MLICVIGFSFYCYSDVYILGGKRAWMFEDETSTPLVCQFFLKHNLFYLSKYHFRGVCTFYLKFVHIFYLKCLNFKFEIFFFFFPGMKRSMSAMA
jgi:hypothetical protein